MKADISLAERRRIERDKEAEIRAILAPRHLATMHERMAVDAALARLELEQLRMAAPAIMARMGCGSVPAPVVNADAETAPPPAPAPAPLPVRAGAPDLPFDLRQRFGLQ